MAYFYFIVSKALQILLLLITMKLCQEITFGTIVTGLVGGHGFSMVGQ